MSRLRGRHFIITVNGSESDVRTTFKAFKQEVKTAYTNGIIRNFSGQLERGEQTNNLHAQIYLGFYDVCGKRKIESILGTNAYHVEPSKNPKGSWLYCQKADTRVGNPCASEWSDTNQGERTDIGDCINAIRDANGDTKQLGDDNLEVYVRHHAGFEKIARTIRDTGVPKVLDKEVVILWGVPGSGKSYTARILENCEDLEYENNFFEFDEFSTNLVLDEADKCDISTKMWLKLLDKYKVRLNVKGGWKTFSPSKLVLTANKDPEDWLFCRHPGLYRRVTRVVYYENEWNGSDL